MSEIIIFDSSMPDIGYSSRLSTAGDEYEMVKNFVTFIKRKYKKLKNKKVALFIEPQLDSGYPDIVIVEYYPLKNDCWDSKRYDLTNTDLKVLFEINSIRYANIGELAKRLGFEFDEIHKISDCNLIRLSKNELSVRKLSIKKYCRISKIISVEAKINKWNEAIVQANRNIWFSTESYILINKNACSIATIEKCTENRIGVISFNRSFKVMLKSQKQKFPVSYASLQFNEMIHRYMHRKEFTNDNK